MTEKLKPCPFCGTEVKLRKETMWFNSHGYKGYYKYTVGCRECGCGIAMRATDTLFRTDSEAKRNAIKAWNRRAKE